MTASSAGYLKRGTRCASCASSPSVGRMRTRRRSHHGQVRRIRRCAPAWAWGWWHYHRPVCCPNMLQAWCHARERAALCTAGGLAAHAGRAAAASRCCVLRELDAGMRTQHVTVWGQEYLVVADPETGSIRAHRLQVGNARAAEAAGRRRGWWVGGHASLPAHREHVAHPLSEAPAAMPCARTPTAAVRRGGRGGGGAHGHRHGLVLHGHPAHPLPAAAEAPHHPVCGAAPHR